MNIDELKTKLPKQPVFKIDFTGEQVGYKNSKLGGKYYWKDEKGLEGFVFLAQINFSELPDNDVFPKTGLLQFFVKDDDCYGLFAKDSFKVVFHDNIDKGYEAYIPAENTPLYQENIGITFTLSEEYLTATDYRFEDYIDDITEEMWGAFNGSGSKLLGYPYFTQYDPRENEIGRQKYDRLLFQLDTNKYLMWGDSGVANFFINSEKLANLDFSDILYNWDCC